MGPLLVRRALRSRFVFSVCGELGFAFGLSGASSLSIGDLQLVVYVVEVGVEFGCGLQMGNRVLGLAFFEQRLAELELRVGVVGIDLQLRFKIGDGRYRLLEAKLRQSRVVMCALQGRTRLQRLLVCG